jgi:hypothetical protein
MQHDQPFTKQGRQQTDSDANTSLGMVKYLDTNGCQFGRVRQTVAVQKSCCSTLLLAGFGPL